MLQFPTDFTDALSLADWLELRAIESADQNASINEILSPLRMQTSEERSQETAMRTWREIEQRSQTAGASYPFRAKKGVLFAKDELEKYAAYLFCLGLSYFGWTIAKNAKINPWYLFEDLACIAAQQYVQGDVIRFGARCHQTKSSFQSAIKDLCIGMGEGVDIRADIPKGLRPKDDRVDLVAWKHFNDKKPSKLIMFGQCAAGDKWAKKITDIQPTVFWANWLREPAVSPTLRSFFIPHRIQHDKWDYYARYAGILFDRCRVSYWAFKNNSAVTDNGAFYAWFSQTFQKHSRARRH